MLAIQQQQKETVSKIPLGRRQEVTSLALYPSHVSHICKMGMLNEIVSTCSCSSNSVLFRFHFPVPSVGQGMTRCDEGAPEDRSGGLVPSVAKRHRA